MSISKIIHSVWIHDHDTEIPAKYQSYMEAWKTTNPDFKHMLWFQKDVDVFIENNPILHRWKDFYYNLRFQIEKCDVFRIFIVLVHSGFYFDLKCMPQKSLNPLIANRTFVGCSDFHEFGYYTKDRPQMSNTFFAATKNHPFLISVLDYIMYSYVPDGLVYERTGPVALGIVASKLGYMKRVPSSHKGWEITPKGYQEIFVNDCFLLSDSFMHDCSHCKNIEPYVIPHFTNGSGWQQNHLHFYALEIVKNHHLEIIIVLILFMLFLMFLRK